MKTALVTLLVLATALLSGCARIVAIEPDSGPPGLPVYVRTSGMFGDPSRQTLLWNGEVLQEHFCGSFIVPPPEKGGVPGPHKVTIVDRLDKSEAMLLFPMMRIRRHTVTFHVTD